MGAYVNPNISITKEEWLETNGKKVNPDEIHYPLIVSLSELPVCLVDNGRFKAAGICYTQQEFERFKRDDGRPKEWYLVGIDKLHQVSPELKDYLKHSNK